MDNLWDKIKSLFGAADAPDSQPPAIPLRGYQGNLDFLRDTFTKAEDFTVREFHLGGDGDKASVVYIKHIADPSRIAHEILIPLASFINMASDPKGKYHPHMAKELVASSDVKEINDLRQVESLLLDGWTMILISGQNPVLGVAAHANPGRAVTTAETDRKSTRLNSSHH